METKKYFLFISEVQKIEIADDDLKKIIKELKKYPEILSFGYKEIKWKL